MKIKVKKRASTQFRKGYPLIQKEDLVDTQVETTEWIDLVDQ
ncbi:MAG: class I SAM-dependent rRNA methyltransferase, partial [Enterococcus thailandicus]|nr:class I SAM-dependent rRNA methyltransferase [Enterococcus thailandicus]